MESKGYMKVVPAHLSEQFLECFKNSKGVDREKLEEMSKLHKGKKEGEEDNV